MQQLQTDMQPELSGYEIAETLFSGDVTRIHRARRLADGRMVTLKALHPEQANRQAFARLQHEYELTAKLHTPATVRVLALEQRHDQPVLVFENFEGESLDRVIRRRRLELEEVLSIAVQVASALVDIHTEGIVHKDINPSNIVYNPRTGEVKVIDFGIATEVTDNNTPDADTPAGSLPYISPEQTGRMNRTVDHRTDFYSLGATLYELLTQRPLFFVKDPIEWLHCHIARSPKAPAAVARDIPHMVSDLVMRLLAKNPEERYQSARGIELDLQHCLNAWREDGEIAKFVLGARDVSAHLEFTQKLYGRESTLSRLVAAFDRAAAGATELVVICGDAGIGKTALVEELDPVIAERGGLFIGGTFESYDQNRPYSAIGQAFGRLVRQLLGACEAQIDDWRNRLRTALGPYSGLLVEAVPEVELILGPQPPVPAMTPQEAELHLHGVFLNFIRVFCQPDHPLVLFLDNEQWADIASLGLASVLTGASAPGHLMIIGAFRDTEVEASHPLAETLTHIQAAGTSVDRIELDTLGVDCLAMWIADVLQASAEPVLPLARLVHDKTAGNPFFVREFLELLHRQDLLVFDVPSGRWRWDSERIAAQQITDNVADLMAGRLEHFSPEKRRLLEFGACIGRVFDLQLLSRVSDTAPEDVADAIDEAGHAGVLISGGKDREQPHARASAAFVHERIRQAMYEAIPETHRKTAHLAVGRLLAGETTPAQLFECLHHYNLARDLISERDERIRLCRLNLQAGRQARATTAYAIAFEYLVIGHGLLPDDAMATEYELFLALYVESAEAAYLSARYERLRQLIDTGLARIEPTLDRVKLHEIRMAAYMAQGRHQAAVDLARDIYRELGAAVTIPRHPRRWHAVAAAAMVRWQLRGKSADDFRHLPSPKSPKVQAVTRIGTLLGSAAYLVRPDLYLLLVYGGVIAAAKRGYAAQPMVYAAFAVLQCTELGQIESGQAFARLAIELADEAGSARDSADTRFLYAAFVRHWEQPLAGTLGLLDEARDALLAVGEFGQGTHANSVYGYHAFYSGMQLGRFTEEMAARCQQAIELEQGDLQYYCAVLGQTALNLLGESEDPLVIAGPRYDERLLLARHAAQDNKGMLLCVHLMKMQLAYYFGAYEKARDEANLVRANNDAARGNYGKVVFQFINALNCMALCRQAPGERSLLLKQVRRADRLLRRWAQKNPENGEHKLRLVEAEQLRLRNKVLEANSAYDRAIELALEQGFVQDAALAAELAADMHHEGGRSTLAEPYLVKAHRLYKRWGAQAKVDDLERRYAGLRETTEQIERGTYTDSTTRTGLLSKVDIAALTKALRTIADERVHSRMVEAIVANAIEFAGAQTGTLILRNHEGALCIEAQATSDARPSLILQSVPLAQSDQLSQRVVNYVARSGGGVVIDDAGTPDDAIPGLHLDDYVRDNAIRSILCLPIFAGVDAERELVGLLYLENNSASNTFTAERFGMLEIICMAAAGRLELSRRAAIDGLTQLYNHEYFQTMLRQEFATASRRGRHLSVILADIDHFKQFNDTWGHPVGDQVLREIGKLLKSTCRDADIVARYGGEEMALILPETDIVAAGEVAERIRARVEQLRVTHDGGQLEVTMSLGVAGLDTEVTDEKMLVKKADDALYRSKKTGRNRVMRG